MSVLKTPLSLVAIGCAFTSVAVMAEDSSLTNPNISAVLDGYYQSGDRAMSERAEGFGLGETELAISANIDDMFYGKMTAVLASHGGDTELELEEAFIQTMALPEGLSVRAGRFLSDVGYLNNQHLHTDSFADRPAVYRAFLGGHYFDDGLRVSVVAPTDIYWNLGFEAFKGDSMRAADEHGERDFSNMGIYSAFTKFGGDIGIDSSWQLGLAYLRNQNGKTIGEDEHEPIVAPVVDDHADDDSDGGHDHSASYTGKNTYIADFVYKWAPNGNYKYQHLTVSGEYFRMTDIFEVEGFGNDLLSEGYDNDYHQGWYASSVYQFSPNWSAGIRYGQVDTFEIHGDHLDPQKLKETELSIAWHHSHFSTVRLQYTHQQGTDFDGFEDDNIITLQYVMTLGAHGAHQF
jgi:hypothetical protein